MTLSQWSAQWPYRVLAGNTALEAATSGRSLGAVPNAAVAVTPNGDNSLRSGAWSLEDYRVSAVQGGSIWFVRRERRQTETTPRYSVWSVSR